MALASVALAQARTLLNDDAGHVWADAALLPKLAIAHQELQSLLWQRESPVVREESSIILVDVGETDLGANQPADLLAPLTLFEYTWAAGPIYSDPVEMTEAIYLPKGVTLVSTLVYWAWREEKIVFLGATAKRGVQIQYRKKIETPVDGTKAIGIELGEMYLGPRMAALAAGSLGNVQVHKLLSDMAVVNFERVLAAQRGQQTAVSEP